MDSKQAKVEIYSYTKKGVAKGIEPGKTRPVEVRSAHFGEEVLVEIFKRKRGVHKARLLEVIKPHEMRVEARCEHAPICGGCSWQHLDYKEQLRIKWDVLKELYRSILKPEQIYPLIPCDHPWEYRNKMEFSFSQDKYNTKYLGLIEADSRGKVFHLKSCHLANSWFAETLLAVRKFWEESDIRAYNRNTGEGTLETLTIREGVHTGERLVMLTVSGTPQRSITSSDLKHFKEAVIASSKEKDISIFLQIVHRKKGMQTQFSEMLLLGKDHFKERLTISYPSGEIKEFLFKVSPSSFFQPNTKQAEKLFSKALEIVGLKKRKVILDLFCGTGTLGIVFSCMAEKVIGVELNPYAAFDAEVNHEVNKIENVKVHKGDVAEILPKLALQEVDLMIVDPPRSGLGKALLEKGLYASPKEILYISCNPYTQKEDIEILCQNGYELKVVQGIDQFPHTVHQESIAYLVKKN